MAEDKSYQSVTNDPVNDQDRSTRSAASVFATVSFPEIQFPTIKRRARPVLKFTMKDSVGSQVKPPTLPPTMKDNENEEDQKESWTRKSNGPETVEVEVSELLNSEPAHVFVESSRVASVFSQSFGHLGPEANPKQWCDGLNFLTSLYSEASVSDKIFVHNLLEELANQMRTLFPKLINGTNALERKLRIKLNEFDGFPCPAAVSGESDNTRTSTSDATAAVSSNQVSHLNHRQ
jgi:hypothetical protein